MPIVSYFFIRFAISILVPTPSVHATIFGFLIFFCISEIEPNPPILLNFLLPFFFDVIFRLKLRNVKKKKKSLFSQLTKFENQQRSLV